MVVKTIAQILKEIPTFEELLKMSKMVPYDQLPEEQKETIENLISKIKEKRIVIQIPTENEDIKNVFRLLCFYRFLMKDNELYNIRSTLFGILVSNLGYDLRRILESIENGGIIRSGNYGIRLSWILDRLLEGKPVNTISLLKYIKSNIKDDEIESASHLYNKLVKGRFIGINFPSSDLLYKFKFLLSVRGIAEAMMNEDYENLAKYVRNFYHIVGEEWFRIHTLRLHLHKFMNGSFYEKYRFTGNYFNIKIYPKDPRARDKIIREHNEEVSISLLNRMSNEDLMVLGKYILLGVTKRKLWNYEREELKKVYAGENNNGS